MSVTSATQGTAHSPRLQLGYNLLTITIGVCCAGLGLAYGIDASSRDKQALQTASKAVLTRTMGDRDLKIPAQWFRYAEQKPEGFTQQVDLTLELALGSQGAPVKIEVSLVPSSRVRPSASLLDGVYLHQFSNEQLSGPPGLIGKPLKPIEGFAQETVWYDPLSAVPFAAKCMAPVNPDQPERCLRTVELIKGMAAVYSFDAGVLEKWRDFDAVLKVPLQHIGVH